MLRTVPWIFGLLLAVAACGDDGGSAGQFRPEAQGATAPPANPGTGTTGVSDRRTTEKLIEKQYRAFQKSFEQFAETNNPDVLPPVTTEPILSKLRRDAEVARKEGYIWRFHNVLNPKVVAISPDGRTATVLDCVHTLASYQYDTRTGKRLAVNPRAGYTRYQATMRLTGSTWKVSNAYNLKRGSRC